MQKSDMKTMLNCRLCIAAGYDFNRRKISVGATDRGIAIWCEVHDVLVGELAPKDVQKWAESPPVCEQCAKGLEHVH